MIRLLAIVLLLISPVLSHAEMKTIEVEFAFTSPGDKTVSSYRLYRDGALKCDTTEDSPGIISCTHDAELDIEDDWTLSAAYTDNDESPVSPAYPFTVTTTTADAGAVDGSATIPTGEVCISCTLTNYDTHTDWSSVTIDSNMARIAISGILNNVTGTTGWHDPSDSNLCWAGEFSPQGIISVRLFAYRGGAWQPGTVYAIGDEVTGGLDGFYYEAIAAGTSTAAAPSWPTVVDETVNDGGVTWQCKSNGQVWAGPVHMRRVYLKKGDSLQKSSTYRTGGRFGFRSN